VSSETARACRQSVATAALRHSAVAHRHSAEMAASDAATTEASSAESASATMESASTAATTAMECHRAGRHRRRADRKGSGERKNLTPHRSLSSSFWQSPQSHLHNAPMERRLQARGRLRPNAAGHCGNTALHNPRS